MPLGVVGLQFAHLIVRSAPNQDPRVVPNAERDVSTARAYPELRTPIILEYPEHAGVKKKGWAALTRIMPKRGCSSDCTKGAAKINIPTVFMMNPMTAGEEGQALAKAPLVDQGSVFTGWTPKVAGSVTCCARQCGSTVRHHPTPIRMHSATSNHIQSGDVDCGLDMVMAKCRYGDMVILI